MSLIGDKRPAAGSLAVSAEAFKSGKVAMAQDGNETYTILLTERLQPGPPANHESK
jgi:hypothetical protein